MNHYPGRLEIERLRLFVLLGRWDGERENPQPVDVSIQFFFKELPSIWQDDQATDMFCYSHLVNSLSALVDGQEYRHIEYLCRMLYEETRRDLATQIGEDAASEIPVRIRLNKCNPPIPYLLEGSCFTYSDLPEGATTA